MTGRVLVAGIGNIFLGDDGFGVEVVRRLMGREPPAGVEVGDFGIRGMDLAYALLDGYQAVVMVDAAPRGEPPGTLSLLEHEMGRSDVVALDTHGMDPVKVLNLAQALGTPPTRILVVACEPAFVGTGEDGEVVVGLSDRVRTAVDGAVEMVESLVADLCDQEGGRQVPAGQSGAVIERSTRR